MTFARGLPLLAAAGAGACTVFAFAPFAVPGVALAALTLLLWLWSHARSPRDGAWLGLAFGAGLFGAGSSWLYIALVSFGGMPPPLALVAIAALTVYLALWPATAGWLAARLAPPHSAARLVIAAAAFTATEWLRGYAFTGVAWLAAG
jgi:apolipoprotein N-acyltransferase